MNIDLYLFNLINQFVGKWPWLDFLGIFFANYFEYILWLVLFILVWSNFYDRGKLTTLKKRREMFFLAVFSAVVSRFVLAEIIRQLWFRPRPFISSNFIPLIAQSAEEASFPSGHATFFFALSTIVYFYNKKLGIIFFIASFFIAIARIFVGVHWPTDILAGALLGIATAWIINKLFRKYGKKT